jgi:hypothetical protein
MRMIVVIVMCCTDRVNMRVTASRPFWVMVKGFVSNDRQAADHDAQAQGVDLQGALPTQLQRG